MHSVSPLSLLREHYYFYPSQDDPPTRAPGNAESRLSLFLFRS